MFKNKLAYEASAGSGKTFNLVVRYLSLLFMGASPSKVLALTFTNKAASEMQERIVLTLKELQNRDELDVICDVTAIPKDEILKKKKDVLEQFLNADVKIMTLDKFFAKILRKFSLYAGLMPNFTTFASQHEQKLFARFLDEVSVAYKDETLIDLSLMMDKRVSDIFSLLDELYSKLSEINKLSFAYAPYKEYEQKVLDAFLKIRQAVLACRDASTTVKNAVEGEEFESVLSKAWLSRDTLDYSTFKKCYQPFMDGELRVIKENVELYMKAREQSFFSSLFALLDTYVKSKKALAYEIAELGFDDISALVHELLSSRIDSEFLYFRLDSKIEHILLDEFQDTSVRQYEILRPLIKEITSGEGVHKNGSFFFVGDVKQSIYRFRGGVSALFDFVRQDNDVEVEPLVVNYRSQKEIVDFVNSVFREKIKGYKDQSVKTDAAGGYVEVVKSDDILQTTLLRLQELIDLKANLNEIAVLTATNGDGQEIEAVLKNAEINVVTETTTKLINQDVVKALIEYLKYLYFKEEIYGHNFFALLGRENSALAKVDVNVLSLQEIVKDAIDRYDLFDGEFHLLRFMGMLENYQDIEQFLFEYERDDTTAAASDLNGVRVLTVHKSKGLEYAHVIVMDRLKKAPPSRAPIIYEYDGVELRNIYLRMSGRDALDSSYAAALQKEKNLVAEDNLNALYVAFTRARENLFIVSKEKDSVFEPLNLEAVSYGVLEVKEHAQVKKIQKTPLEYKALRYGIQTDILSVAKEEEDDRRALNFGLALHYCLEMMQEFTKESLQSAYSVMLNRYGNILDADELAGIQKRIEVLLKNERFLELVKGEHFKEKGMLVKGELRYMDLLVKRVEGGYNIIDYKSSQNPSENHVKQVLGYKRAVQEITSCEVRGYLCYLHEDETKIKEVL
ncbi:RecB-like helicase [Sulfurimonas sp. HSL-1716]|uniref:RecB-like helicase n=1 Tax=Hydrocurvibacter sulfurireducens TaxID=3131937 RepID=UPI0031FA1E08